MNSILTISLIAVFAAIMGTAAMVPALAQPPAGTPTPPSDPPTDAGPPDVDICDIIASSDLPDRAKDKLLEIAGCV